MTDKAIIQASLIGIKNVATHKSVALTIHVPQERAMDVINAFGWPTMIDPIDIIVARLNMADASTREDEERPMSFNTSAAKPKREMTLASRVAIICKDKMFQSFCFQQLDYEPISFCPVDTETTNEESTSNYVRKRCKVKSRSEIKYDTPEAANWKSLYEEFQGSEYAA